MGMTGVRIVIAALIVLIVAVSLVPMFVLLDLAGGGDGFSLCEGGLSTCKTSYFDGLELLGLLALAIFVLLMLLRVMMHVQRFIIRRPLGQQSGSLSESERWAPRRVGPGRRPQWRLPRGRSRSG